MRAIVETEDKSHRGNGSFGTVTHPPLRMVSDGLDARNKPFRRFLPPITGKQRPHDRAVAEFAGRWNDPGIAHPKGRAKPFRGRAQRTRNRVVAEPQLNPDLSASEAEKIRMRFGVIADEVSTRDGLSNEFWTFAHVSANQEKCRTRVVAVEKVKQLRRDRRIRSIVECKNQLARGVCPADRFSKKLCTRMRRAVSKRARRR